MWFICRGRMMNEQQAALVMGHAFSPEGTKRGKTTSLIYRTELGVFPPEMALCEE